jgi:putative lysine transport system substrate-binding protein
VVTDKPTGLAAVAVYPELKLLDFTGSSNNFLVSEQEINIGISLKKGNTDLLNKINEALAGLTSADFDRMMKDAIKVQPLSVEQ